MDSMLICMDIYFFQYFSTGFERFERLLHRNPNGKMRLKALCVIGEADIFEIRVKENM